MGYIDQIKRLGLKFNDSQQLAIDTTEGPVVVIAGPGAGKTTMMCARIGNMISKGVNPDNILCVTFSKASAIDMDSRFKKMFGNTFNKDVTFATIHSLANRIVQIYYRQKYGKKLEVIKEHEKKYILQEIYKNVNGEDSVTEDKIEAFAQTLSYIKNKLIKPAMFASISFNDVKNMDILYTSYQEVLKSKNLIDFDDMLVICYEILRDNKEVLEYYQNLYHYIMLDEAQDTSVVQFNILKLISDKHKNICAVGDDDQNIYAWRGAEVENFLNFERLFPGAKKIYIEQNYRSSQNIVEISNDFIKTNAKRYNKELYTKKDKQTHPRFIEVENELSQIDFIISDIKTKGNLSESAVLYRNNFSSLLLVDRLEREGIPYNIKDNKVSFFSHFIVKDIVAMLNLSLDNTDIESFSRVCSRTKTYVSKNHIDKILKIKDKYKQLEQRVLYIKNNIEIQKRNLESQERQVSGLLDDPNSISMVESYQNSKDLLERDYAQYTLLKSKLDKIKNDNNVKTIDELSVFDILLSIDDLKKFQKEGIIRFKQKIESLKNKDMNNIIPYIEHTIGYKDYILDNVERLGFSEENANQILFLLKQIFKNTKTINEGLNRLSFLKDKILNSERDNNALSLSTLHGSKGLEWENVYMIDLNDGIIPSFHAIDEADNNFDDKELEGERRLFYVGLTRAKSSLNLITPKKRIDENCKKSMFVIETMASLNRLCTNPNSSLYDPNYVSTMDVISNTNEKKKNKNTSKQQEFDLSATIPLAFKEENSNFGGDFTTRTNYIEIEKEIIKETKTDNKEKVSSFEKNKEDRIKSLNSLNDVLKTNQPDINIDKRSYLSFTKKETPKQEILVPKDTNELKIEDLTKNLQISHISFGKGTIEKVKGNFVYIIFDDQTEAKMFRADKLIERNLIKRVS